VADRYARANNRSMTHRHQRGKPQHAEAERADGVEGPTLSRRGVLGGLAALPVLYSIGSATPALTARAKRPVSVPQATGTFPDYDALRPASDSFANTSVRSYVLEVPVETWGNRPHSFATALAYGAWAADPLLPNVITFTPGTAVLWDPWSEGANGKGVIEDICVQHHQDGGEPGLLLGVRSGAAPRLPPLPRPAAAN
jgi:hypothetical protein